MCIPAVNSVIIKSVTEGREPVQKMVLIKQTYIYFKKIARIAFREKAWKFIIFAVIIAALVAGIVGDDMFTTYESTKSGFFTITSACIWIGIFNSIQSICKEHDIIRSEYRQGMKLSAYISANICWQMVLCLVQSVLVFAVCNIFIDFNSDGIITSAYLEYFITIFLLTFGSAVMGIMLSSVAGNPTTAMTIMPFVLILQLIMSGVLFELTGLSEKVAYITFSKWGMSAFGSIADLNNPKYPLKISAVYPMVERLETESCYDCTADNLITAWVWCIGLTVCLAVISIVSLKIKNRDS